MNILDSKDPIDEVVKATASIKITKWLKEHANDMISIMFIAGLDTEDSSGMAVATVGESRELSFALAKACMKEPALAEVLCATVHSLYKSSFQPPVSRRDRAIRAAINVLRRNLAEMFHTENEEQ